MSCLYKGPDFNCASERHSAALKISMVWQDFKARCRVSCADRKTQTTMSPQVHHQLGFWIPLSLSPRRTNIIHVRQAPKASQSDLHTLHKLLTAFIQSVVPTIDATWKLRNSRNVQQQLDSHGVLESINLGKASSSKLSARPILILLPHPGRPFLAGHDLKTNHS